MCRRSLTAAAFATVCLLGVAPWTSRAGSQTPARDPAAPQPPRVETASISGTVVQDGASGTPVRRATVTVSSSELSLFRPAVTDDAGRFRVDSLPAGRFTLTVTKAGYVGIRNLRTPPPTVTLADGQHASSSTLRLTRGGIITGRVVDHTGQPVRSAAIVIAERRQVGTQITTRNIPAAGSGFLSTNDLGVYRAYGLPAGTYVVAVTPPASVGTRIPTPVELQWAKQPRSVMVGAAPPPGPALIHAAVYYPATTDIGDATTVTVTAGEERSGVDIVLELVATTEITGQVTWEDGQPVRNAQILALARTRPVVSTGPGAFPRVSPSGADGRFVVSGLVPGNYTITARAARPTAAAEARGQGAVPGPSPLPSGRGGPPAVGPDLWATAEIRAAGQRIDDLALVLRPGLRATGRLVFEGKTTQPTAVDLSRALIAVASVAESAATLRVSARGVQSDGSFVLEGLLPGAYTLTSSYPSSEGSRWLVKSATAGGRDILDAPLELQADRETNDIVVTFTDQITELSGRVSDKLDRPVSAYYIVAFSTDRTRWRQGSRWLGNPRRPSREGQYSFTGLPPGEYYLAALPEYEQTIWFTPEYLEQVIPGAIKVTIGEGEKKAQDIKLGI